MSPANDYDEEDGVRRHGRGISENDHEKDEEQGKFGNPFFR
jgi:hypothetical protein